MRVSPSLQITWGPGSSAWPLALSNGLQVWTNYLSTAESDQLGVLVDTTQITTSNLNVYLQIWWTGANEASDPIIPSTGAGYLECVEEPGLLVSEFNDTYQRYSFYPKEWGPIPKNVQRAIWVPTAAQYFRLALYTDANAGSSDACKTIVLLASSDDATRTAH